MEMCVSEKCAEMCVEICAEMCVEMCAEMCVSEKCAEMCVSEKCAEMCGEMWRGRCLTCRQTSTHLIPASEKTTNPKKPRQRVYCRRALATQTITDVTKMQPMVPTMNMPATTGAEEGR